MLADLRAAMLDAFHPIDGRITGLGQQIALGQHEKYWQTADIDAGTAACFQFAEEPIEFGELFFKLHRAAEQSTATPEHQHQTIIPHKAAWQCAVR